MQTVEKRAMKGLKSKTVSFRNISDAPLSTLLDQCQTESLILCGTLAQMTREYVEEAQSTGWIFERRYIHKTRTAYFKRVAWKVSVHLCSELWFPKCTDAEEAEAAYAVLSAEFTNATALPLLSTPAITAHALMWSKLPQGQKFDPLPDHVAKEIRSNSPQHRIEKFQPAATGHKYDGRWMYAALSGLDRLPVGDPVETTEFEAFTPGFYWINFSVPAGWAHIGLLPVKRERTSDDFGKLQWFYPREHNGETYSTFAAEPEIALALANGWEIEFVSGFQFGKGRPLGGWTKTLVELRSDCNQTDTHAGDAIRQILNHGIGKLHSNTVEREKEMTRKEYIALSKANGIENVIPIKFLNEGERVLVRYREAHTDKIGLFFPHWSAQIYALERARLAYRALQIPFSTLLHFQGDAMYLSQEAGGLLSDTGSLGQFRYQMEQEIPNQGGEQ